MKLLTENSDWHKYYDYLEEYDEYTVLRMLANGENLWVPLIQPAMYQQALNEFTKFGKFEKFPIKYIYQWMGIIMKNTAIIRAITSIAGHDMGYPTDAIIDAMFNSREEFEEYKKTLEHKGNFSPDFGWTEYDEPEDEEFKEVDDEEAACQYLEDNGYFNKMTLPDGSSAWSDYGIQPLEEIILEYNDSLEPEKVLVLINRALDVTHQRGDLASAFIEGGYGTLTSISNKGYVNENIKAYHGSPCGDIVTGKFKRGKHGYLGPGIYFSEDQYYAKRYAKKYGRGTLYTAEIRLNNPLVLTDENPTKDFLTVVYGTESVYLRRERKQSNSCYIIEPKDIKKFLSMGYDGVIWDFAGNKEYVLYDNSNITIINKEEVLEEGKIMKKDKYQEYIKHFKPLFNLMREDEGIKNAHYPKVVLHTKIQKCEPIMIKTGYFDPSTDKVHIYLCDNKGLRTVRDVAATFTHECTHYIQKLKGVLEKNGYNSEKITEDNELIKLEMEAYLKSGLYLRKYREKLGAYN